LVTRAVEKFGDAPHGLSAVLIGDRDPATRLTDDPRVPLVSATGSTRMGRTVGPHLAQRFARAILELGGNNAAVVCPSADLELALRAIAFAAIGNAGQRCTTLRRLFIHRHVYAALVERLKQVYATARVGNPLEDGSVLIGPLIDEAAFEAMKGVLGDKIERVDAVPGGYYVRPAIVEVGAQDGPVLRETFAPILYVLRYRNIQEAIALNNSVPQGLSSSIFTTDLREAELFMSAAGSDCGIANVNIGPSGAEIGGAFGGEKETGGGRESGSDAWRAYMRRQTNTINFGSDLPLAQGIRFDVAP